VAKFSSSQPQPLDKRIERELEAGRFSEALQLAKTFHKQEQNDRSMALLRTSYLNVAESCATRGSVRDGTLVLNEAEALSSTAHQWYEQIADFRARLGDVTGAMKTLEKVPGSTMRPKIIARLADRAIQNAPRDRAHLPADLHAGYDLIIKAQGEYESGNDDAMNETLKAVSISSPFMDWKLLLRGLAAYAKNDDQRAIENWSRLNLERVPARLAAPLRSSIDPAFRVAQLPKLQSVLLKQMEVLGGGGSVRDQLNQMKMVGGRTDQGLAKILRLAEAVVPVLKREQPGLVARLANVMYWMIRHAGQPDDMARYRKAFGPPKEDPEFFRLQALVLETIGDMQQSHDRWKDYVTWIAKNSTLWPEPDSSLARALIWEQMAENAIIVEMENADDDEDNFLSFSRSRRPSLKPNAEECFRKSLALVPNRPEAATKLLTTTLMSENLVAAAEVGEKYAKLFPNHLPLLVGMIALELKRDRPTEAVEYARRALKINPLDRKLQSALTSTTMQAARIEAAGKQYDKARSLLAESESTYAGEMRFRWLCVVAAIEYVSGNKERAEVLLGEANALPENAVAIAYRMLAESITMKMKPADKKPLDKRFNDLLAGPTTTALAAPLIESLEVYKSQSTAYHGLKTHESKIIKYASASILHVSDAKSLLRLGEAFIRLNKPKFATQAASEGARRFHQDPFLCVLRADTMMMKKGGGYSVYQAVDMLKRATQLAAAQPNTPEIRELQERIASKMKEFESRLSPFARMFGGGFMNIFGGPDEEDF